MIRKEYMPIQRREAVIELTLNDLADFLSTFVSAINEQIRASKSLSVRIEQYLKFRRGHKILNILPFVCIKQRHPEMQLKFHIGKGHGGLQSPDPQIYHDPVIPKHLNDLKNLISHDNAQWKEDIANGNIKKVFWGNGVHAYIHIRGGRWDEYGLSRRYGFEVLIFRFVDEKEIVDQHLNER